MPLRLGVNLIQRPASSQEIAKIASDLLRRSNTAGLLPTPIDEIIAAANLTEPEDPEPFIQSFLSSLPRVTRDVFLSGWQKIRGIADLRERVIYIPRETKERRRLFVKSHELGHQVIPWHRVNMSYRDDDFSLGFEAQEIFDQEANFFGAEVIFQGQGFTRRARDYQSSFEAVFQLADDHGASRHATLRRFVEEQDETIALLPYWPSQYALDPTGHHVLRRGKLIFSPRFLNKFENLEVPLEIQSDHPWTLARNTEGICAGEIILLSDGVSQSFRWQSWWNSYTLFIMLRRKPVLSSIGHLLKKQ